MMGKITASQRRILEILMYVESYEHIREETSLSFGEIRDDLITLSHRNMIEVFEGPDGNIGQKVRHFDNDHPESFYYRVTREGMNAMSRHR